MQLKVPCRSIQANTALVEHISLLALPNCALITYTIVTVEKGESHLEQGVIQIIKAH